jgi:PAS domain S-box-containing protein
VNALAAGAASLICVIDDRGRVTDRGVNLAFQRVLGCDGRDVAGKVLWEHWVEAAEADEVRSRIEAVADGAVLGRYENHWRTASGERLVVAWTCIALPSSRDLSLFLVAGAPRPLGRDPSTARAGERLSALVESAPVAIIEVGLDNTVRLWNPAAERIFGWSAQEVLGRPPCWIPEDRLAEFQALSTREAIGEGYTGFETVRMHRDGRRLEVEISAAPIRDVDGDVVGAMALITDISERKRQAEELRASRARIVEAADDARRKLERNLHDGAQQRLVTLALTLRLAEERLSSAPTEAERLIAGAREELVVALAELRELARGIHPAVLTDRGLAVAVEALASRAPLPVEVDVPPERLPPAIEAALYYFVAESLTNVARYAGAGRAHVRLALTDGGLVAAEVSDDGCGGANPANGSGLRGLTDRIETLGGRLVVDSPPGGGTRVRMEVPLGSMEVPLNRVRAQAEPPTRMRSPGSRRDASPKGSARP